MKKQPNVRALRRRLKLNQGESWTRLGITQSGGSRYEGGRTIPKPVLNLLRLAYAPLKTAMREFERLRRA